MSLLPDSMARLKMARYGAALIICGSALGLRAALFPEEPRMAYAMLYPAMVLALYFCGTAPGLLLMVVSCLVTVYYFTPPYRAWAVDAIDAVKLSCFVLTTLAFAWAMRRLRTLSAGLSLATQRAMESQRQLQAVIDEQTEMLLRFDANGHLILANPAARSAFGLPEGAVHATWHSLVGTADHEAAETKPGMLSQQRPLVTTENRFHDRKGEPRWGEFVHRALFDSEGRLQGVQTVGRDVTERRALQAAVQDLAVRLQDLYDNAPCGYYSLDPQGRLCQANAATLDWLGCSADEVMGRLGPRDFFTPDSAERASQTFATLQTAGTVGPVEFDLVGRHGRHRRVSITATAVLDSENRFIRSRSVMYDVTELDQARRALQSLNKQQAVMLDNELVGILKLRDRQIIWSNRASEHIFGYGSGELVGLCASELYANEAAYEAFGDAAYGLLASGQTYRAQLELLRRDGRKVWVDVSGVMLSQEPRETMWMSLDITAMKAQQARIEHVAFHDGLTGLPNRLLLMDRLSLAVQLSRRTREMLAVCFLDMDGFKAVNDSLGHAAGDELLRIMARRLLEGVRAHDTVSRFGGDEFVLMLPNLRDRLECNQVIARIQRAVAAPVPLGDGATVTLAASVGIACFPDDGPTEDSLLKAADKAMYAAKADRRTPGP
ncbi:MAG TPA: diguanylate cyclase [Ideonella sp.]|uniref:diguanylate cyclase n=1 Tax=Ideonella sp. TaxID=1929293 RepID=UPI002C8EAA41|nr:diguanylate cyclase [Ideonella sp.]HSI48777.1 diguanylate cyclase [Ideonella sp.]